MRRWAAVVVAVVVLVPLLGQLPVAPAAAEAVVVGSACDASGDGTPGGLVVEVVSNGADGAAQGLAEDTGVVLTPARPAWQWRVPVCVEVADDGDPATDDRRVRAVGAPVGELKPDAVAWQAKALERALGSLRPHYYRPAPWTSPAVGGVQIVGLETWLAVQPKVWEQQTATDGAGEVEVTATASPKRVVWEFSDGVTKVCDGPGVQWTPGVVGPAPCGREFTRTTAGQPPMILQVRLEYQVVWSSTIGGSATVTERGEPFRAELVVGEVQTYLSDGVRGPPPGVDPLPLPESTQPVNDKDCSWFELNCSLADILNVVADKVGEVASAVFGAVKVALEQVWKFLKGCVAFIGEVFGSVGEVLSQMGQLFTDPQGFISEKLELVKT